MEDYSHLEGKEIKFKIKGSLIEKEAVVALIDKDIGITIVSKDDPEYYLACMIRPSSHKWLKSWDKALEEESERNFYKAVKMIEEGVYITGQLDADPHRINPIPTIDSCPFY